MWGVYGTGWQDRCQDLFFCLGWERVFVCVGTGERGWWVGGFFVMVRLLLLYIVINTGKWDLTVFKMGCVGGFLCESFINRKPNDGLCV